MARVYSAGFELGSSTNGVEGDTYSGAAASSAVTRSGTYALRANPAASTAFWRTQILAANSTTAICYLRFYLYIATATNAIIQIGRISDLSGTTQAVIRLTTGNQLQLCDATITQIGSNSSALTTGTWYRIEVQYDPVAKTCDARINGVSFASGANTTGTGWGQITLGAINGTPTCDLYFDDVAINDDSGSFQNTWPGDGKIIHLRPNAAGDNTGLTVGVSDNVNHYLNVDEVTPDDDVTYNQTSTASQTDDYNIDNSGIGATDTVNVVSVGVRYRKVTSGTMVFNVRAKASAGGTVESSSNISSATTTFKTNAEVAPFNYPLTMYDLPGVSTTPWTQADLDLAQIGVNTVSNTANNWRVTAMWMLVDYTPAAGVSVVPGVASLATSTFAPTIQLPQLVTAGVLALAISTFAPTVTVSQTITPGVSSLAITSFAPVVTATNNVTATPALATLATSAIAPTVSISDNKTVVPSTIALTTATFAPQVNLSVIPGAASLATSTFAPTVSASNNITATPATRALTISSFAPTVVLPKTVTPGVATLSLSTFAPTITAVSGTVVTPSTKSLSLTTFAPTIINPVLATPATVALTLTTFAPQVEIRVIFQVAAPPSSGSFSVASASSGGFVVASTPTSGSFTAAS